MNKEKIKNLLRAKRILTPTPNSHRLVSAAVTGQPTRTFTSDNAGNITLDDRGSGNTVTITIGADGRPQTVVVAGTGATTVNYKHNALGERVSRVEGGTTTHFHYDLDGTLIAESDGAGIVIREYLWLGTKPVGLVVGPAGSPTLYFVHADHLDRVQKITDGTQALVWDGQFTPYGRTHAITGTVTNPLRFPGQWADPAAGYFYNYMRDYDPTLARYLSVDPLGTGGGRNKFSYAGANPQNLIDPQGLRSGTGRFDLRWIGTLLRGAENAGKWAGTAIGKFLLYELYNITHVDLPDEVRLPPGVTVPIPPEALGPPFEMPSIPLGPLVIDPHSACGGPLTRPDPLQMAKGGKQILDNEYGREAQALFPNDPEGQKRWLDKKYKETRGSERLKVQEAQKKLRFRRNTQMK